VGSSDCRSQVFGSWFADTDLGSSFDDDVVGGRAVVFGTGGASSMRMVVVVDDDNRSVLSLTGTAPTTAFRQVLDGLTLHQSSSTTTFTLGSLPDGYRLVIPPTVQPVPVDSFGLASPPGAEASLSIDVQTDLSDQRFYATEAGTAAARSIFIGGDDEQITGWYSTPADGTVVLSWQLEPGITLVLRATRDGMTPSEAIQIADDVVLTDEATWRTTYGLGPDDPITEVTR